MKTCRQIDPELLHRRGATKLLQKHAVNLTEVQRKRLSAYLAGQPAVARIHEFKEELMAVLNAKNQTKALCRILVHRLLDCLRQLQESPFEDRRKLGCTLAAWQVERSVACGASRVRTASPMASIAR